MTYGGQSQRVAEKSRSRWCCQELQREGSSVSKHPGIHKVLVIGSGPIVIGQAAEFDYAGTQACRALKQEGVKVVLVNSNPATSMTDPEIADQIYIEPLTKTFLINII